MTMHNQQIVACVKCDGKILRERGDVVTIPFGSTYSIYLRNLGSVRAEVSVSVDGRDIADGQRFVINPNSSMEIERFLKNENTKTGNKFKFIERTAAIEDHRGIGSDDGLIRVEAWRERITQHVNVPVVHYYEEWYPIPRPYFWPPYYPWGDPWRIDHWGGGSGGPLHGRTLCNTANAASVASADAGQVKVGQSVNSVKAAGMMRSFCAQETEVERGDAGITVAGGLSEQQFQMVSGFPTEAQSTVVVLRLRGEVAGKPVTQPVTVASKPTCVTCGKTNRANHQFCDRCGTALVVI